MELENKIDKAHRFIDSLNAAQLKDLQRICRDIMVSQDDLNVQAAEYFKRCMRACEGICCKNINVNDVVTQLDLIYVLAMGNHSATRVQACAALESLYTADCPFLANRVGPCIFPPNIKPERCIITFCGETRPIRKAIKVVRSGFSKLSRYSKIKRPFLWVRF